jgi:hypothetical protein
MDSRLRMLIIGLRLGAISVMIMSASLLWWVMERLSWQVDCLLALAATVAFAYWFERDAGSSGVVRSEEQPRLSESSSRAR